MERAQARVQEGITKMINTLDKENLRKMQADMYNCSAKCCENSNYNMEDVQRCVETCSHPVNQAQNFMQEEMKHFQERLQRCALDCQDKTRDRITPSTSESDVAKYRGEMEACVVKCADTHTSLIPSMLKRMKEVLQKK